MWDAAGLGNYFSTSSSMWIGGLNCIACGLTASTCYGCMNSQRDIIVDSIPFGGHVESFITSTFCETETMDFCPVTSMTCTLQPYHGTLYNPSMPPAY